MDWKKYAPYITKKEVECKCGCGFSEISSDLLDTVLKIRLEYDRQMTFTSGCRCKKHNANVGGKADSAHITGNALDIAYKDLTDLYILIKLCYKYDVKRFGINFKKKFIHIDNDKTKVTPCVFPY